MGGIYIHIPFCKQACSYCNFHFSTSLRLKSSLIAVLIEEFNHRSGFFDSEMIDTLYFGGGTPSLLNRDELKSIMSNISANFNIKQDAEITLEANPDDITVDKVGLFAEFGVNRLSIGIQSFYDEDLLFMNRAHNSEEAIKCIEIANEAGISDINIDLIYGTPSLTDDMWRSNLARVRTLGIPHLSAYQLTVEPGTALSSHIRKGKTPPLPEAKAVHQFEILMDWAEDVGFEHYEISNLSLPGRRSRHNTSYWQGKPYLGVGPSAHSFKENTRSWNIANNALYIKQVQATGMPSNEEEILTNKDHYNEYVMTGLRLKEGISLNKIIGFGESFVDTFLRGIEEHVESGAVILRDDNYFLSRSGKIFADRIASDCFLV